MKNNKLSKIIIILSILMIILSDFRLTGYSESSSGGKILNYFSDMVAILMLFVLLLCVNKISRNSIIFFLSINIIILINILINLYINYDVNLLISYSKIILYSLVCLLFFNYINNNKLHFIVVKYLVSMTCIFSAIAICIYIIQIFSLPINYQFMWKYLRQDPASYYFANSNIVRLRGLMNEPALFGVHNCFVLAVSYFNKVGYRIKNSANLLLIVSTLLTLSFSTLPLLLILIGLKYLKFKHLYLTGKKLIVFLIFLIIFTVILYFIKDELSHTIFERFQRILAADDGSANKRINDSWGYIRSEKLITGWGIGNSPELLFNNYAYILTEIGLFAFIMSIILNIYILFVNPPMGIYILIFMFQKGSYLAAPFWMIITYIVTLNIRDIDNYSIKKEFKQ